jgi:hypothetical protein
MMPNAIEIMIDRMCDGMGQAFSQRAYHFSFGQLDDSTLGMVAIPRRLTPAQIHELNQLLAQTVRSFVEASTGEKLICHQEGSGEAIISADGQHIVEVRKGAAFPSWRGGSSNG